MMLKQTMKQVRRFKNWNAYDSHERTFIIIAALGTLSFLFALPTIQDFRGLMGNISSELGGAVVTYLLIDRMIAIKERQEEKDDEDAVLRAHLLTRLFDSNEAAVRSVLTEMREHGWIEDGSFTEVSLMNINLSACDLYKFNGRCADMELARLADADMYLANLEEANLKEAMMEHCRLQRANLTGASLWAANLQSANLCRASLHEADLRFAKLNSADLEQTALIGANMQWATLTDAQHLTDAQLASVWALQGATMSSGYRYNGCYNLRGDMLEAAQCGVPNDPELMADFYGVSVEEYRRGQEWARQNLRNLPRCETWPEFERATEVGR
jgi:uncharacterized protein YjbI with pentapeptide repeats